MAAGQEAKGRAEVQGPGLPGGGGQVARRPLREAESAHEAQRGEHHRSAG